MNDKRLFRVAAKIQKFIKNLNTSKYDYCKAKNQIEGLKNNADEIMSWYERLEIAKDHRLFLTADRIEHIIRRSCDRFCNRTLNFDKLLGLQKQKPTPSLKEIYLDLKSLDNFFDSVCYTDTTLYVETKEITLRDEENNTLELGKFSIGLETRDTSNEITTMLFIEAIDPNPAVGSDDSIIHPHVQANRLCVGEAGSILYQSLVEGRILDFFITVNSTLKTYNSESPFRAIKDWESENITCAVCGYEGISDEDAFLCECGNYVCDECTHPCYSCDDGSFHCSDCVTKCHCDNYICASCSEYSDFCGGCNHIVCNDCKEMSCEECGDSYCPECIITCNKCNENPMCCVICDDCGERRCSKCIEACDMCKRSSCCTSTCENCQQTICRECTWECDNCNLNFCSDCYDEEKCSLFAGAGA